MKKTKLIKLFKVKFDYNFTDGELIELIVGKDIKIENGKIILLTEKGNVFLNYNIVVTK